MKLDPLDAKILRLLQADARHSMRDLADAVGTTPPTVTARVKALEELGVIRGYRAWVDPALSGGPSYVVTLTVQPQHAHAARDAVAGMYGAQATFLLPGGRIVAHLRPRGSTLAQLHDAIAEIPGLVSYDANETLDVRLHDGLVELKEEIDLRCHQCKGPIHGEPVRARIGERLHVFCCKQCHADFKARHEAATTRRRA